MRKHGRMRRRLRRKIRLDFLPGGEAIRIGVVVHVLEALQVFSRHRTQVGEMTGNTKFNAFQLAGAGQAQGRRDRNARSLWRLARWLENAKEVTTSAHRIDFSMLPPDGNRAKRRAILLNRRGTLPEWQQICTTEAATV